jgi:hypothetical protein
MLAVGLEEPLQLEKIKKSGNTIMEDDQWDDLFICA